MMSSPCARNSCRPQLIFGYGSIINNESRASTSSGKLPVARAKLSREAGLARSWSCICYNRDVAYLLLVSMISMIIMLIMLRLKTFKFLFPQPSPPRRVWRRRPKRKTFTNGGRVEGGEGLGSILTAALPSADTGFWMVDHADYLQVCIGACCSNLD